MSESTTAPAVPPKAFACNLCDNSYDRSQDLGVHKYRAHGVHGPKTSAFRSPPASKATGGGASVKQPEPVPAAVQTIVNHVNETHIDGPKETPEQTTWTPPLPSGSTLPARTDLRFEVIITRLRLISAELEAGGVSAPTRAVIEVELLRVRNLVSELEGDVA